MSAVSLLLALPISWPWSSSSSSNSKIWPGLAGSLAAEEPTFVPASWLAVIAGSVIVCWVLPFLILKAFEDPVHAEDVVRRISEVHIPSMVRSASGRLFTPQGAKIYRATCDLSGTSVFGRVHLTQVEGVGWTTISYEVTGLKPGPHGFSIHESGEGLSLGDEFAAAGRTSTHSTRSTARRTTWSDTWAAWATSLPTVMASPRARSSITSSS